MPSQAYTPGLKVKKHFTVNKTRRLPLLGEVLVKEGERVSHDTIVARTSVPGPLHVVNVCHKLGVDPDEINKFMLKKIGDDIEEGEAIARFSAFFGILKEVCYSPITGKLELCSVASGQVILRAKPTPVDLFAYIPGTVDKILSEEGVEIRTPASYIQGIFGIGGECAGEIKVVSESTDEVVGPDRITKDCEGKVLICGSLVSFETLKRAIEVGANGLIVGGIEGQTLRALLGEDLGVVITGQERIGITLIVTEGFGKMSMQRKTFELLKQHEGRLACINGATQIRAGVVRPEIIVPLEDDQGIGDSEEEIHSGGLAPGTKIRIIREPYFGELGTVLELPVPLYLLESESGVRVLVASLEDGRKVTIPRANVEIIEE